MALRDFLGKRKLPEPEKKKLLEPPPEVDFSELWRDPEEGAGGLQTILGVANAVMILLVLILGFFHL